jgi:hypothetical protein
MKKKTYRYQTEISKYLKKKRKKGDAREKKEEGKDKSLSKILMIKFQRKNS